METIDVLFLNSIKDKKDKENLEEFIKELVFELAFKKFSRMKDRKRIQKKIEELYDIFHGILKQEKLDNDENLLSLMDGLIRAVNYNNESQLYDKMYEKERIEKEIQIQQKLIQTTIADTFKTFEKLTENSQSAKNALHGAKLREIYMLGILQEVTSQALITTIEKGEDIDELSEGIIKNIVYQAINAGEFKKDRFLTIAKSVIDVAIEISTIDLAHEEDILKGTIIGAREGILKAVEIYKNNLKYAPDEIDALEEFDLNEARKQLHTIEDNFIELLHNYSKEEENYGKIIDKLLKKDLDNTFAKMQRMTNETKDIINERLDEIRENASLRLNQLKQTAEEKAQELSPKAKHAKEEAKKLGEMAWVKAKEFAKNAMQRK